MSKLSLIEQSKKAQTSCSSSSSSSSSSSTSSLSTSTVASRVASSKSTSIITSSSSSSSSKRRSTTSRQQHNHYHQQPHHHHLKQQQQQHQLISVATSQSGASASGEHTNTSRGEAGAMLSSSSATSQQTTAAAVQQDATESAFCSPLMSATGEHESGQRAKLAAQRPVSALELRLKDRFKGDLFEEANEAGPNATNSTSSTSSSSSRKTFRHEEEESRVRRRQESTCISSTRKRTSCLLDGAAMRESTVSSSSSSSSHQAAAATTATSLQKTTSRSQDGSVVAATTSSSSCLQDSVSAQHFRSSASLLLSNNRNDASANQARSLFASSSSNQQGGLFLTNETDFSSPDARSIFREVGSEFAMLESAMNDSNPRLAPVTCFRMLRTPLGQGLASRRPLSPLGSFGGQHLAITGPTNHEGSPSNYSPATATTTISHQPEPANTEQPSKFSSSLSELSARLNGSRRDEMGSSGKGASERIKELLSRAQEQPALRDTGPASVGLNEGQTQLVAGAKPTQNLIQDESRKIFMSESIERIDQRMGELCVKLQQCKDSKEAVDLLKIIIQMIEKAWSVPVCGDDLGFKLCNSLREAGGLDFVLGFIQDTVDSLMRMDCLVFSPGPRLPSEPDSIMGAGSVQSPKESPASGTSSGPASSNGKGLKLDLRKVTEQQQQHTEDANKSSGAKQQHARAVSAPIRDNDSDIITSDLGLDSASVESLSYVSPSSTLGGPGAGDEQQREERVKNQAEDETEAELGQEGSATGDASENDKDNRGEKRRTDDTDDDQVEANELVAAESNDDGSTKPTAASDTNNNNIDKQPEIEEPAFLCARLLSQCLTSENRDYIVRNALDSVIRLACSFSTIKSSRIRRLLSCGTSGELAPRESHATSGRSAPANKVASSSQANQDGSSSAKEPNKAPRCEHSDAHAVIGTEILQHLFKHSEETCHRMIGLGGLQAILYGCRSSNVEVLRHCASALANLALYGGPEGQQRMIEQKAHVWLFPLAFNEDDNVQYYACLAIVVLVANKEIEADVLKSSTLDLVEPFVLSHEPQRFAESTTAHIHGQSASWLRKLIPLLESKRQEARNLACFHFAMEAHIKREQTQTELFRQIGAVDPLRKVGSSPQAIAARFACQALRLIGEKEPHKLSQQVPLWTSEDVVEWVSQIGFERFRPAFVESRVDGDLLLQLDEAMLKSDIGIDNGIIRRRFLRELTNLKRISDYSSMDKTGLCGLLTGGNGQEFIQYVYPLLQLGVTRDTIHLFDCEQLLRECNVNNIIHQIKLAQTIKDIQERQAIEAASQECNSQNGTDQKTLDVFVSYRRSTGSQLASLLKVHLQLRGFSVFIDVERLEAGKFDNNLLDSIKAAKNFIIVLSPSALDRCVDDHGCKDWVHKEIVAALASNCNIIPIIDNFHWPDPEQLPEDMRSIIYFNGVRWIHDYQDACIDKVERFIRGEINNPGQLFGCIGGGGGSGPGASGGSQLGSSTAQSSLQRLSGGPNAVGNMQTCSGSSAYSISSPSVAATPSLGLSNHSPGQYQFSRPPPFDGYHHPLSYISQQLQQHSQSSQTTTASGRRN